MKTHIAFFLLMTLQAVAGGWDALSKPLFWSAVTTIAPTFGRVVLEDGYYYGDLVGGVPHGYGVLVTPNRLRSQLGRFEHGRPQEIHTLEDFEGRHQRGGEAVVDGLGEIRIVITPVLQIFQIDIGRFSNRRLEGPGIRIFINGNDIEIQQGDFTMGSPPPGTPPPRCVG